MNTKIIPLGLLALSLGVSAGQDKGNGLFLYSRTSKVLLDDSQKSLLREFDVRTKTGHDPVYLSEKCLRPVDLTQLQREVSDLRSNYVESSTELNPEGQLEERAFHIRDGKIEATKEFFASFVDTYFRYIEESDFTKKTQILQPIREGILHEGLHLFGYDEMESRACAPELENLLASYDQEKLHHMNETIKNENRSLIQDFLKSHCSKELGFLARGPIPFPNANIQVAWPLAHCIQDHDQIQREDPKLYFAHILRGLGNAILNQRASYSSVAEVADFYFKFSFEKPLIRPN